MLYSQIITVASVFGVAFAKCGGNGGGYPGGGGNPPAGSCTTTVTTPTGPPGGCATRCAQTLISDGGVFLPCGCSTLAISTFAETTACPTDTNCIQTFLAFGTFTETESPCPSTNTNTPTIPSPPPSSCVGTVTTTTSPPEGCATKCANTVTIDDGGVAVFCGCNAVSTSTVAETTACPTKTDCTETIKALPTFYPDPSCTPPAPAYPTKFRA